MGCLQNKYRDTKLTDMEILALKDKHVLPTPEVLNSVLHDSYPAFEEWDNVLSGLDIKPEWNYYKDGNAWLCKMMFQWDNIYSDEIYDKQLQRIIPGNH